MNGNTVYSAVASRKACDAARLGHTMLSCAARAGIDRATLYRWLHDHEAFRVAFGLAKNEGRAALESRALAVALDDPKHALELLSRRYPDAWGRRDRVKLDANVGHTMTLAGLPAAERARLLRLALAEADGESGEA